MKKKMPVLFYNAQLAHIKDRTIIKRLIVQQIIKAGRKIENLNVIFLTNQQIAKMNKKHLQHTGATDVITFAYQDGPILADIFVGVGRVRENAKKYKATYQEEFCRVIFHGVLHILGFDDKDEAQQKEMRRQEEKWLSLYRRQAKSVSRETLLLGNEAHPIDYSPKKDW